jgi:hypothetical protein
MGEQERWIVYGVLLLVLVALLLVLFGGCATVKEGDPVDLRDLAQPEKEPLPPLPKPSRPPQQAGKLRVWVPRQETPNGDIQEGYYLILSAKPPQAETVEPPQPLPRLPHQYQPRRQQQTPPQRQQPAQGTRQTPPGSQGLRPAGQPTGVPASLGMPGMEMGVPGMPTPPVMEVP